MSDVSGCTNVASWLRLLADGDVALCPNHHAEGVLDDRPRAVLPS